MNDETTRGWAMTDLTDSPTGPHKEGAEIDTTVAHAGRVYDYLLGGVDNFAIDREVCEQAFAAYPGGFEAARIDVRANRAFLGRAVRHLAGEVGIRQFLDIGTGIPNADNTHAVAREAAPDSRIVYVDNDPIVLAHAHQLLRATPEAVYLKEDFRNPQGVLQKAADTLDLSQPVALMLVAILHLIKDEDDPYGIVAQLVDALAPGSYLVISHLTDGLPTAMTEVANRLNATMLEAMVLRGHAEVSRFFDGTELMAPGVVQLVQWEPHETDPKEPGPTPVFCGVGRKP
jgi:SAM-dependent methyltransferase